MAGAYLEKPRYGGQMTCEIAFCPFGHALSAPGDEDILWKTCVRVFNSEEGKLDLSFRKVLKKVDQFTLYTCSQDTALAIECDKGMDNPPPVL